MMTFRKIIFFQELSAFIYTKTRWGILHYYYAVVFASQLQKNAPDWNCPARKRQLRQKVVNAMSVLNAKIKSTFGKSMFPLSIYILWASNFQLWTQRLNSVWRLAVESWPKKNASGPMLRKKNQRDEALIWMHSGVNIEPSTFHQCLHNLNSVNIYACNLKDKKIENTFSFRILFWKPKIVEKAAISKLERSTIMTLTSANDCPRVLLNHV